MTAGGGVGIRRRVLGIERVLRATYRRLTAHPEFAAAPSHAAEWLLDNQYVLLDALRQTAESLPRRFYRELPQLADGELAGQTRIYALARGLLEDAGGHVDLERAERFLESYQRVTPLSMGELWALPAMLRLGLLEDLASTAALLVGAPDVGDAATDLSGRTLAEPVVAHSPPSPVGDDGQAAAAVPAAAGGGRVAVCILGLRAVTAADWKSFFERVSRVEAVLRQDPSELYAGMDFATRDDYRKAVERIAKDIGRTGGQGEETVAETAVELAQNGVARRRHVGFYLIDRGRSEIESALGSPVGLGASLRRRLFERAVPLYLFGICVVASAVLAGLSAYAVVSGESSVQVAAVILLGAVPALTIAVALGNWTVSHVVKPRLLPKLDFEEGVPDEFRTMVVVPIMLSSEDEVRAQLRELEVTYLANPDPNVSFALLTDVVEAAQQHMPADAALIDMVRNGLEQLNERYPRKGSRRVGGGAGDEDGPTANGASHEGHDPLADDRGPAPPFYLFHRERRWNACENCWMGWERKRGKLAEFNRLLRGADDTSFALQVGNPSILPSIRFVITVDADTFLPPASAGRLIGTLAHPLNRAELTPEGEVLAGYTVLQPRVETVHTSTDHTLFSRVFEADSGLDLYTHAFSDAYQDLAAEGVYAGKGIYDPDAFEASLAGRAPENALLSHDLFEGIHGRAALVSDIPVFEQFPTHVLTYMRRLHRWVRGDWQIAPWLLARVPAARDRKMPNPLSVLDRWKILDNLRRSLLAPSLVLLAIAGWAWLPGAPWVWTLFVVMVLGVPIFLQGAATVNRVVRASRAPRSVLTPTRERVAMREEIRSLFGDFWRWLLGLAFLPFEAYVVSDAIVRTLWRLGVTRKHLLEWTTAAHAAKALGRRTSAASVWREMAAAPVLAVVALVLIVVLRSSAQRPAALLCAAPLLLLWLASPQIAHRISQVRRRRRERGSASDTEVLRLLARRTWLYFQHFHGPSERWLPPDNYQEEPGNIVARRTSPTNIGLSLLSTLTAYDMGYVGALTLEATLRNVLETVDRLERYRGHFLNWYDTRTLTPLLPRYVSTVDSGNLAACLLTLARGCEGMPRSQALRTAQARGFLDTLLVLDETVASIEAPELQPLISAVRAQIGGLRERIEAVRFPRRISPLAHELVSSHVPQLEQHVVELAEAEEVDLDTRTLREIRVWMTAIRQEALLLEREANAFVPWLTFLADAPALYRDPGFTEASAWHALRASLHERPALGEVPKICRRARKRLAQLEARLESAGTSLAGGNAEANELQDARDWNRNLAQALEDARRTAEVMLSSFRELAGRCTALVDEMEFGFLYDGRRDLFQIGYNVTTGLPDANYYDLLASESRLASFFAIAKGDVPPSHWLHLGRPFGRVNGTRAVLSWGGTMFEYLMPGLLMRTPEHTLLEQTCRAAIERQISHGAAYEVPWGVSESGFAQFDPRGNYQYRAFGVPGLGMKRDAGDRLVVSPYASLIALPFVPREVQQNLERLANEGMLGRYGLYEALDYGRPDAPDAGQTPAIRGSLLRSASRKRGGNATGSSAGVASDGVGLDRSGLDRSAAPRRGQRRIVRSYMAHHQGMILVALDNYLNDQAMVRRFHAQPRVATVEYLLHEQIPWAVRIEPPLVSMADGRAPLRKGRPSALLTWRPVQGRLPQAHVLSNGRYSVLITASGGGESRWKNYALTRWRSDSTLEEWGTWIYVRDLHSGALWSAGYEPTRAGRRSDEVAFSPYLAEFQRLDHGISLRTEVTVPPENDLEIRRVRVVNHSDLSRRLALASYGEVVLAPHADDRRHPAFNKLFIESEVLTLRDAILFRRRPRSAKEEPLYLLHALIGRDEGLSPLRWETARGRFLGRLRTQGAPAALVNGGNRLHAAPPAAWDAPSSGEIAPHEQGLRAPTLDPIFSLGCEIELAPNSEAELAFLTLAGGSRAELISRLDAFSSGARLQYAFEQARTHAGAELQRAGLAPWRARQVQELLSALIHPSHPLRAAPHVLAENTLSRRDLWRHGLSGDHPILLAKAHRTEEMPLVRELLQAHAYWREHGVQVDLAILDYEPPGYTQPLRDRLNQAVVETGGGAWVSQPGGIFLLEGSGIERADEILLESAAAVVLDAAAGPLTEQLERLREGTFELPPFVPLPSSPLTVEPTPPLPRPAGLLFDNGWGGFTPDGREYVITVNPGEPTPAPWINVVANPRFGFLVSETGAGCTWAAHSAENRLTPWRNDPVEDAPGESLYVRDEEIADIWSVTPLPAADVEPGGDADLEGEPALKAARGARRAEKSYIVRHGAGYSSFEHNRNGLEQRLLMYAAPNDPVKIVRLRLTNRWRRHRRITATYFAEWILGESRELAAPHVVCEYEHDVGALLARNPFNEHFGRRVAFLASSEAPHGLTSDRTEFLGRNGSRSRPAGLLRIGLAGTVRPGTDPCAALQAHVELAPGETRELHFVLGQGADREEALALARRYRETDAVDAAWNEVTAFWDRLLGTMSVRTPDRATDVMLNRWLLYQTLSCRIWGRSGLYQSSGAYGFRDQLQDTLALLHAAPELARAQILESARHQFEEGDVLHWWHPPADEGVRTRCSDDLLWLPFATAVYVQTTGDEAILDEVVPFLRGEPLAPDEHDRYMRFETSPVALTLYEHCARALQRGITVGPHGLPLIGSGDWNDGLDRVGAEGKGESVWLAWFLRATISVFSNLADRKGDPMTGVILRTEAERLGVAVEAGAWDGQWYRRAYYDDGTPLGSAANREAQIDSLSQSWAVLAEGDPERARQAMEAVWQRLVRPVSAARSGRIRASGAVATAAAEPPPLVCLFWPPFERTARDPGYIKGYPPGVRENGGQYSHGAAWVGWAFARLGDGERAFDVLRSLNPILRSATPESAQQYRVEPYVTAGDIYSAAPFTGRGGWTWYTGSAGWTYRLGIEAILGLRREGETLRIDPCIPSGWPGYEITYRVEGTEGMTTYNIRVENPDGVSRGVAAVVVDGVSMRDKTIQLSRDAGEHEVVVRLGDPTGPGAAS